MKHFCSVISPIAAPRTEKYGAKGPYSAASFPSVPAELVNGLVHAANHAVTKNTHSSYKTALKLWNQCARESRFDSNLPCSEQNTLIYVAWLIKRGVRASTIEVYLSGIRAAHLESGLNPPNIRTDRIKLIINGKSHEDCQKKQTGELTTRLPITPNMLKLFKAELSNSNMSYSDTRMIWAVACMLFFGGFRPGELLCRNSLSFDPHNALLGKDIKMKTVKVNNLETETMQVYLVTEKADSSGNGKIVDIYSSASTLCPIQAFKKFRDQAKIEEKKPVFRLQNGKNFTTKMLNEKLKQYLGKHVDTECKRVTGHSFRIGIASLVAQLGYSEEQIKSLGRWSSEAYLKYLRLPRTRREEMARELQNFTI